VRSRPTMPRTSYWRKMVGLIAMGWWARG
jgi:hypothetical protein